MNTKPFYLIMDQQDCWAAGKTKAAAWKELSEYMENSVRALKAKEIEEHESRNGTEGFFVYEVTKVAWPENADQLDGGGWCKVYYQDQELKELD